MSRPLNQPPIHRISWEHCDSHDYMKTFSTLFIYFIMKIVQAGLWSRSRSLGLETYQRLVSVSSREKLSTSRSREADVSVSAIHVSCLRPIFGQIVRATSTRNSSGDKIANVNFLYDNIVKYTTKYNKLVHKFRRGYVLERMFTKFSKITQYNGHYAVRGHSRSPILVPIESSYTTSY